jgi:hypothetical protein
MTWTADTPTQPGYYFWRGHPECAAVAVWVSSVGIALRVGTLEMRPAT